MLWEAVFQTKYCWSPKVKSFAPSRIVDPPQFFGLAALLIASRSWLWAARKGVKNLIGNPGTFNWQPWYKCLTPLQLPSVHHNRTFDACAHDAAVKKENAKREFGRQNVAKVKNEYI